MTANHALLDPPNRALIPRLLFPALIAASISTISAECPPSELNLATAEGLVRFNDASHLRAFHRATLPVALIRIPGKPTALDLLPAGAGKEGNAGPSRGGAVGKLGYLLDTYPNDSLRLITREPHFGYHVKLQIGKWTHVAATVDGTTGKQKLYINGKPIAAN